MPKADLIKRAEKWIQTKAYEKRGKEYEPFLTVNDVSSRGVRWRTNSLTVGRTHHLLSSVEAAAFFWLDSRPDVTDIREQNLIPPERSHALARELGIRHPIMHGRTHLMTLDFWISFKGKPDIIYSIKKSDELSDRTVEKQTIERTYVNSLGLDCHVITERKFSPEYIRALELILPMYDSDRLPKLHMDLDIARNVTLAFILMNRGKPLNRVCLDLDGRLEQRPGTALSMCRHLIATRRLLVDLTRGIDTLSPLPILNEGMAQ